MTIIYLVGTDGSGKTTLAFNLLESLQKERKKVKYFYARHFPVLLFPFKLFAKKTLLKKSNQYRDYNNYHSKKTGFTKRFPLIGKIYGLIWFIDYLLITYLRLIPQLPRGEIFIIDRYYLDVAVNISETLNLNELSMKKMVKLLSYFFPKPSVIFYIDVPSQVAFSRKDDIQSIQYLDERRNRYLCLSEVLNYTIIDGKLNKIDLLNQTLFHIKNNENL